jgi:hypothetical protein
MSRSIIIGLKFIGLLLLSLWQKNPIEITHDPPVSMQPGEEQVVTVVIDKSDVTGFAKFQIALGEGLKAEVVETAGASFTFNNQKAKFIWMALPQEREFTIKYRLVATPAAAGAIPIESRFSYIYNNERKNFDVETHRVVFGNADDLGAEDLEASTSEEIINPEASASVSRTITSAGINQWKVNVVLKKSNLGGFAKIEEEVPEGYTAIDLKSSGAVFSSTNEGVKYLWYDIPANEEVMVSYKLLPVIVQSGDEPEITGRFSYLQNEETIVLPILTGAAEIAEVPKDTSTAEIEEEIADLDPEPELTDEEPVQPPAEAAEIAVMEEPVVEAPKPEPVKTPTPPVNQPEKDPEPKKKITDSNIVDVPEPQEGIFYRVQIAAGPNNLQPNTFAKLYGFDENFGIENYDGLFKYTTGYHQIYKEARNDRERIRGKYDKFDGPFVTAYNDGERITVQEALMVSNQKWYP